MNLGIVYHVTIQTVIHDQDKVVITHETDLEREIKETGIAIPFEANTVDCIVIIARNREIDRAREETEKDPENEDLHHRITWNESRILCIVKRIFICQVIDLYQSRWDHSILLDLQLQICTEEALYRDFGLIFGWNKR